jgi:hypothetical protein
MCSNVYADVVADVKVCDSPGVLRTMKILGILIVLIKVIVPLLLIIMSIIDFGKSVIAGNAEDLKKNTVIFFKRCVAGAIILILPSLINFLFDNLVDRDEAKYQVCSNCLFNPNNCSIPDKEPETTK